VKKERGKTGPSGADLFYIVLFSFDPSYYPNARRALKKREEEKKNPRRGKKEKKKGRSSDAYRGTRLLLHSTRLYTEATAAPQKEGEGGEKRKQWRAKKRKKRYRRDGASNSSYIWILSATTLASSNVKEKKRKEGPRIPTLPFVLLQGQGRIGEEEKKKQKRRKKECPLPHLIPRNSQSTIREKKEGKEPPRKKRKNHARAELILRHSVLFPIPLLGPEGRGGEKGKKKCLGERKRKDRTAPSSCVPTAQREREKKEREKGK